ncbi:hypothetical protein Tco_1145399 [Tanacetum coccineum]
MSINCINQEIFCCLINNVSEATPSDDSLVYLKLKILVGYVQLGRAFDYGISSWKISFFKIDTKSSKKGKLRLYLSPVHQNLVRHTYVMEMDPLFRAKKQGQIALRKMIQMFSTINVISRNEVTQLYGAILASGTNHTSHQKKPSRKLIALMVVVLEQMKDLVVIPGSFPMLWSLTQRDDYILEVSEEDQDDEQDQDDDDAEKHDVHKTTQEEEEEDDHDDDENDQEDDDARDDDRN